jgi:hypothetical protein
MKLYTEEELLKAIQLGRNYGGWITTEPEILKQLTPIELPSDDDMANASNHCKDGQVKVGFLRGVLWLKEQILNQNNNMAEKIEHIVDPNKMITAVNWLISKQKHNKFFDIETIEEAREMEKYQIGQFLNWFIKHYSTTNIDGFFGWADSMDKEVTIADILAHYYNENPTQ